MKVRFFLLVIYLLLKYSASKQDLADIRYHFTTCGAVGRNGPEISQCMSWYRQQNSSIVKDNRLFQFISQDLRVFSGSQGFRIDKTGYYDVAVAGAAGGRGICSIGQGKGLLWKGRIKLRDTQDLLILVGQKGGESCDEQRDIPVCKSPPNNTDEANKCIKDWDYYLFNHPKLSQSAATMTMTNGGGGGGGGASMIRIHDRLTGQFSKLPIVVVGGGGGTGSSVEEFEPDEYNISFPSDVMNSSTLEQFDYYINAKSTDRDITIADVHNFTGIRGYIAPAAVNNIPRAGAGGGYFPEISLQQDGSPLNISEGFAKGGFDCLHLSTDLSQRPLVETVHGGFGGGGGQCETGGSGGGYTGGSVFSNRFYGIPGNGGFYKSFSQSQNEVVELSTSLNPGLDGFVELELTECGCGYKCVRNETEQTFWCDCPVNTTLAANLFDCYFELDIEVSEYALQKRTTEGLEIKYVPFNETIEIFSVLSEVSLSEYSPAKSQTLMCILLFTNQTGNVILKSNVIRESDVKLVDRLAPIEDNSLPQYFLTNPLAVSGVTLASTGMCTIDSISMNVNIKQQDSETRAAVAADIDFDDVIRVAMTNVNQKQTDITSDGFPRPYLFLVISLVTFGVAVFVLLIITIPVGFKLHRNKRRHKNNGTRKYNTTDFSESMVHNLLYDRARSHNSYSNDRYQEPGANRRMKRTSSFTPKYEIVVPDYNFIAYNREREMSNDWEYSRSSLVYMKELGEGHFGKVLLMKANGIAGFDGKLPVAVKTLSSTKSTVVKQFTEEADLMKELSHPNIIALLGVSFEDVDDDNAPLMILEYMPYGDLQDFLTNNSPDANATTNCGSIEICHMFSFATDVANGLVYLFSLNFIHGDIATRNCLVGPNLNIKISDFGLTKKLEDGATEYKLEGSATLPLRWLSPESLTSGKFSHASDIWSYGVLLWEIATYGELPLKNMSGSDIMDAAERKTLKHLRPPNCPNLLFDIMSKCHQQLPQRRISVGAIVRMLTSNTSETE